MHVDRDKSKNKDPLEWQRMIEALTRLHHLEHCLLDFGTLDLSDKELLDLVDAVSRMRNLKELCLEIV
jgi:hypothetical protein